MGVCKCVLYKDVYMSSLYAIDQYFCIRLMVFISTNAFLLYVYLRHIGQDKRSDLTKSL